MEYIGGSQKIKEQIIMFIASAIRKIPIIVYYKKTKRI
jgi:hypothetical protein